MTIELAPAEARAVTSTAISLAFGVLFSTLASLILLPASYPVLEDLKGVCRKLPLSALSFFNTLHIGQIP